MSNFDTLLRRNLINNDSLLDSLFPVVENSKTNLGNGDTYHTVKQMKSWVLLHYKQCEKLASLVKRSSLKETVNLIYKFLYNSLQYKQDNLLQQLRSPSNSIQHRKEGLDCKSYSIFASCILTSLGIKHYIRQIKQPSFKPTRYTHVYVVVPINQENANLKEGYYTIDGTVKGNVEPIFTKSDDTFMEKLPHVGLNGAKSRKTTKKKVAPKKKTTATKRKKPVATKKKKSNMLVNGLIGIASVVGLASVIK